MSIMYTDAEVMTLGYQASRMELVRVTTSPAYDTPAVYVARVASQAALQAPSARELGTVVATMRRWLGGRSHADGLQEFTAAVSARPFQPDVSFRPYNFV
jgi:hypothetical protein